jgi:hypothetical protein
MNRTDNSNCHCERSAATARIYNCMRAVAALLSLLAMTDLYLCFYKWLSILTIPQPTSF